MSPAKHGLTASSREGGQDLVDEQLHRPPRFVDRHTADEGMQHHRPVVGSATDFSDKLIGSQEAVPP